MPEVREPGREAPEPGVEAPGPGVEAPPGRWAERVLADLTLREKVGQLIMPWVLGDFAPAGSESQERVAELVEEHGVGGIIMSVGSPLEVTARLNDLQARAELPLLVAADVETGAGFRFRGVAYLPNAIDLGGATRFPTFMALGATGRPGLAYEVGRVTALESRALGIHIGFAPVLDVNNNPDNPIINVRSFGEDPEEVSTLGAAFVRGAQEHGLVATAKHFPGHGDSDVDSHLELGVISYDRERLEAVELLPFRRAVDAGVGAVMSAHIAIPALTGEERLPATLSRGVLTRLLREDMGFDGLVFTDAMDMHAIDENYGRDEATILSLEAGADVVLMPPDPQAAIDAILGAVATGRLSERRIDASVLRLLRLKESLGLHRGARVPLEGVLERVGIPAHREVAQRVADLSVTLLRDEDRMVPIPLDSTAPVLSVTYRRPAALMAGRTFDAGIRESFPRLGRATVDAATDSARYARLLDDARAAELVVVSAHVAVVSYSGSVAVPEPFAWFVSELARRDIPHVVVSFGNPYLIREFPEAEAYLLAWSSTQVSQRAAARALTGRIPIQGRTPTRIPPHFEIGDGMEVPVGGRAR